MSGAVQASMSCATWSRLSPTHWWVSNLVGRSIAANVTRNGEPAEGSPFSQIDWNRTGVRLDAEWDKSSAAFAGGGWLVFAGGPAAALAASHLRSPATFTVQLDHLLSSVLKVNHSQIKIGTHFWA